MATTNSIADDKRASDNKKAKDNAVAKALQDKKDVSYGKWVEITFDGSMKRVYEKYVEGDTDIPFSNMIIGGRDTNYSDIGSVYLENNDDIIGSRKSGFLKVVLKDGWMAKIDVRTENEDYFYDNINGATERDMLDFGDSPAGTWDEQISFTLCKGGDYLSIDIDNESGDVGQFTLVVDGTKYTVDSPYTMDNEAKVWLQKVYYWVSDWGTVKYAGSNNVPEDDEGDDTPIDPDDSDIIPDDDKDGDGEQDDDDNDDGDGEDDDEDDDDDTTDDENYSIFLVLGGISLILVGAFVFLRRGGSSAE